MKETPIIREIYKTYELYKKDEKNRSFYDCYIDLVVGDYPEQREYYLKYWETLKENGEEK